MRIEQLRIKNYRVFRDVALSSVPTFCVLVGANGTGKSTLFDVFGFLRDALHDNVHVALAKRGGFSEVVSRGQSGPISLELKFRELDGPLVTYLLEVDVRDGRGIVKRELLKYRRGQHGRPWTFLDFREGKGTAVTNEVEYGTPDAEMQRETQALDSPDILAIKSLGQFQRFRVVSAFRRMIESWHLSDFHIQAARPSQEAGYAEGLDLFHLCSSVFKNTGFQSAFIDRRAESVRMKSAHLTAEMPNFSTQRNRGKRGSTCEDAGCTLFAVGVPVFGAAAPQTEPRILRASPGRRPFFFTLWRDLTGFLVRRRGNPRIRLLPGTPGHPAEGPDLLGHPRNARPPLCAESRYSPTSPCPLWWKMQTSTLELGKRSKKYPNGQRDPVGRPFLPSLLPAFPRKTESGREEAKKAGTGCRNSDATDPPASFRHRARRELTELVPSYAKVVGARMLSFRTFLSVTS